MNDDLFAMPELKIHYEAFADAPEISPDKLLAEVEGRKFTWNEIEGVWKQWIGKGADNAKILGGLKTHGGIAYALAVIWGRQNNIMEEASLKHKSALLRTGVIGSTYVKQELDAAAAPVTAEQIQAYYDSHVTTDFTVPPLKSYQIIERRLGPKWDNRPKAEREKQLDSMMKSFSERLKGIASVAEFIALAQKINPEEFPDEPFSADMPIDVRQVRGATGKRLMETPAGSFTQTPFRDGDRIRAVAVIEQTLPKVRAFIEVQADIQKLLAARAMESAKPKLEHHLLTESRFEFALK